MINNDSNNDLSASSSTSSQSKKRHQRSLSHKHLPFNDNKENSIDADEMDLALSLAFPNDMENMKKYTDDIWRKTLSSDCDSSTQVWEKQPEVKKTPAVVWPSTSSHGLFSAPKNHYFSDDIWLNMSGGNIFFPTSAPSTSASGSSIKKASIDLKHGKKVPSKVPPTSVEFDDDFNNMKKRLSLSSLRTSLCRQKAVENLNNGNSAHGSSSRNNDSDDDFLQVDFSFFSFYHS